MTEVKTLDQLKTSAVAAPKESAPMSFLTSAGFDQLLRVSNMLSSSTMVPVAYRKFKEIKEYGQVTGWEENPAALANCAVALNMAQRMNADPLMIMQNLHIIEGRPSWSTPFIIASINSCGRYTSLDYDLSEPGEPTVVEYIAIEWVKPQGATKKQRTEIKKKITVRHQSCIAFATEKSTGKRLESPKITIQMAVDEGWLTKNGSKWQTMPELMLRYRCASFFGRLYAPELLMGLQSREEVEDFIDATQDHNGDYAVDLSELRNREQEAPKVTPEEGAEVEEAEHEVVEEAAAQEEEAQPEPEKKPETKGRKRDLPSME